MIRTLSAVIFAVTLGVFATVASAATIESETVKYKVGDQEFTGYIAWDDDIVGERPGIIVVHEWWGHNDYARRRADLLAANGYTAFALDMYGTGKLAEHPGDAKAFMMESIETSERLLGRFNAALTILKTHWSVDPEKTAAIGYCFGGAVVLNMARAGVDLDGVVSFHGNLSAMVEPGETPLKTKIRAYTGADDPFVPMDTVTAFKAEMDGLGADYEIVAYPGVMHSFTNPGADAFGEKFELPLKYDAKADGDSWIGTLRFFDELFK